MNFYKKNILIFFHQLNITTCLELVRGSAHQLFITLCIFLSVAFPSFSATETSQSSLHGNEITANANLTIQDQWFSYMQSNPLSWQNTFGVKQTNTMVILRFDDTKKEYFSDYWNVMVTYDVILTYKDFTTDTFTNEQIQINYDPTQTYKDISINRYVNAHKIEVNITSVNADTLLPDISLDVQMNVERYYKLETSMNYNLESKEVDHNQLQISWDFIRGAEYYELEFLFVDMLDDPFNSHTAFDFDNATRISTTNNFYDLSLAYPKGALIYRVRGIGFPDTDFIHRTETNWSYNPDNGKGFTDEVLTDYLYAYSGLNDSLNWQYTVSYAEEGKRKEVFSVADGSMKNRFSLTLANTDSNALVYAPVYDYQGRQSIQMLSVPVESNGIQYYQANDSLDINGGFNRENFDVDSKFNNPDSLPFLNAARIYYSPDNPDKDNFPFIPDANGYAYSQTQYKNDGSERISKQSGLGENFKLGSGHETKYYYGAPTGQVEFDRLYGSEVGFVEHYKKNMIQDPNGQISVSYIDEHGRTIATALAGEAPDNLIEIDHKPAADTLTANLLAPNLKVGSYEMRSSKVITVSSPSDFYFIYDFRDTIFCDEDTCLPCQDCLYDLVITITNEEGSILYNSTEENNNEVIRINSSSINHFEFTLPSSIMTIGTYTVTKSLKLNQESIALLDSLFTSDQLCVPYDSIEPEPCYVGCESLCEQNYTRTDVNGNTYYVDDNGTSYNNISDVQHLIDACITQICENQFEGIDECSIKRKIMLADVSPGGQYFDNTPDQYIIQNGDMIANPTYDANEWLNTQAIPSSILTQYSSWNDVRTYWQDAWAEEMLQLHPEICNYEYYCEYQPDISTVIDPKFSDYREYDKFMLSVNNDSSAFALPYYLFNPTDVSGTLFSNGPTLDNSNYINLSGPSSPYADPFFVNNYSARNSMEYYLTHFLQRESGSSDYYSVWYVIDDPDNISNTNYSGVDSSVQSFFSSLHNNLFSVQGVSKFQYFRSIYSYFKKSIIAQQYPKWHDYYCDQLNNDYYLTDVGDGKDSLGYYIRWPENAILKFDFATLDSLLDSVSAIVYPEEFDKAACSCDAYQNYLQSENLNDYEYSSIAGVLLNLSGINYSTTDIAGWRDLCSSGGASTTDLENSNFPLLFYCTDEIDAEINMDSLMADMEEQCMEQALLDALYQSDKQYQENLQTSKEKYLENYALSCFNNIDERETFTVTYTLDEYLYTLYYYDQANNLVKTVPPQGVAIIHNADTLSMIDDYRRKDSTQHFLPSHTMVTQYTYNSLNQLSRQNTPDGGTTYFWYDEVGRLCVSQNAKQKKEGSYSYSEYDALSRIVETGKISNVSNWDTSSSFITQSDYQNWLYNSGAVKSEVSYSYYDKSVTIISGFTQENLRGRIASITYDEEGDSTYDFASHFSYDEHGNVKSLIQENVKLSEVEADQQYRRIDYEYDLVSGNVKVVRYQSGQVDEFHHYYQYDSDNRLTKVSSSDSPLLFSSRGTGGEVNFKEGTLVTKLFYYPHGPLRRVELGDKQVQGLDYAYTLQGWLKAVNSSALIKNRDIGADGATNNSQPTTHNHFAQDALGFSLQYYTNDYSSINNFNQNNYFLTTNNDQLTTNLYNGNISQMVLHYLDNNESPLQAQAESYDYDQLNRIKESTVYTSTDIWGNDAIATNNTLTTATDKNDYKTAYDYDFNGNIESLIRHGSVSNIKMDSLLYFYNIGNNQLNHVLENTNVAYSTNYATDIDAGQIDLNYIYDEIGNLTHDEQEEIDTIIWNIQGKIKEIRRKTGSTKSDLIFYYDALGNRIGKLVIPRINGQHSTQEYWTYTWYSLDASGNLMATYEQAYTIGIDESLSEPLLIEKLSLKDQAIYSNKRIGLNTNEKLVAINGFEDYSFNEDGSLNRSALTYVDPDLLPDQVDERDTIHYTRELGNKRYELTDHLGNVRSVISDRKIAINELEIAEENFNEEAEAWYAYAANNLYSSSIETINEMLEISTQGYSYGIYKEFKVIVNRAYKIKFDLDLETNSKIIAVATNNAGSNSLGSTANITTDGTYSFNFTATTDTIKIFFLNLSQNGKNTDFYIDNFKLMQTDTIGYYVPDVISAVDYYPFGSEKPGRVFNSGEYKYAYNGKEKDDEIKGSGNSYDYGARIYDPKIGKWLSIDPYQINYSGWSPYNYVRGNPILRVDVGGNWDIEVHAYNERGTFGYGILIVKDDAGKEIYRTTVRLQGSSHSANSYNPRNRMATNADTPTGVYDMVQWESKAGTVNTRKSYGPNDVIRLSGISGEITQSGRSGILLHGGRQENYNATSQTWSEIDPPVLKQTYGCIRIFDEDIKAIKDLTTTLEENNSNETMDNLTVTNDLVFDSKTNSYFTPTDYQSLDNARKNLIWAWDFNEATSEINEIEGKGISTTTITPQTDNEEN